MRYVNAKYDEYEEQLAYRIYISDTLFQQGQDKRIMIRYIDLINPKPQDTRTADEIAADVILRAGLHFEKEE